MQRVSCWLMVLVLLCLSVLTFSQSDTSIGSDSLTDDVTAPIPEDAPAALLSEEDSAAVSASSEKFEFQAEVHRLMDILINSLYSNRDIFIRELISNAADALDKVRYLALTNQTQLAATPNLDIRIAFDRDAKTISLTDTGVGMTRDDLIKNLGVVAKSGTSDFLEAAAKKGSDALSLIGQFGVGFYSVYLVADRVTVVSKHHSADSEQYIWESTAEKSFSVSKDPRGNTLGRGTQIILHMKDDASEFINEHELRKLVERYSEFINYPIYLYVSKMVEPDADPSVEEKPPTGEEDEDEVSVSETDEEAEAPKAPAERVEKWFWTRLNDVKAIWTRSPADITDDEYAAFYKTLTKDEKPPLAHIHFTAEGEITFRSILFVPSVVPAGAYDRFYEKSTALKLYVRRVLISDEFDDFLPRYLNFIKGVVDSDDLPLNVSRETLAQSKVLRVMAKKLIRKVLEMLKKLSDKNKAKRAATDNGLLALDEADDEEYNVLWKNFGKSLKLGVIDDKNNKAKLTKLLRFVTSKSEGQLISLDEYVDRMKPNQKNIYYVTGESVESVSQSPFVERLLKKDIEVVYMVDPVDEYLLQPMTEYEGTKLMSVTKEGLKIDEGEEKRLERYKTEYKPLTDYLLTTLGSERVNKVTVSNRVASSPMVIVTGQYGWSSNMERIMSGQTFGNVKEAQHLKSKKTLEINPLHPIIRTLQERVVAGEGDSAEVKQVVELLWDASLLQSGFVHDNPTDFAKRIHRLSSVALKIDPEAAVAEEAEEEFSETSAAGETAEEDEVNHEEL